jgi:hypothetical protein
MVHTSRIQLHNTQQIFAATRGNHMKCFGRALAVLSLLALAASVQAATLTYNQADGTATITPDAGGVIIGYDLTSNGKFFVDPARVPTLGSAAFFTNTESEIGDSDLTFAGKSIPIPLAILFPLNDKPTDQASLAAKFTGAVYIPALGQQNDLTLSFNGTNIPEPATAALGGLCLLGLAAARRRMFA